MINFLFLLNILYFLYHILIQVKITIRKEIYTNNNFDLECISPRSAGAVEYNDCISAEE